MLPRPQIARANRPNQPRERDISGPLFQKELVSCFDGGLILSSGENEFDEPKRVLSPVKRGLTVAVALTGRMTCRIDDRPLIDITGPNVSLILNHAEHRREQVFEPGIRLRYAIVHMAPRLIEEKFGIAFDALIDAGKQASGGHDPAFLARPADAVIRSIASRIMSCPINGLGRDIYLAGKGLEMVALTLAQFLPTVGDGAGHLTLHDIERVQAAREILLAQYREPPPLPTLSRQVGLNMRKLNAGFRQTFGMTVHAFLQEHRLQQAYQKMAASELNVSEIAYEVGYTPAHFATIFRKRFGFSPSDLR